MLRHTVRPGITGLAQIAGRNKTSWDARLAYDAAYAKKKSFWLYAGIFFKTYSQLTAPLVQ
jgi:lipopolysaccharide/colanic/teichoic acid biosynthesis glycosyltransferase